MRLRLCQGGTLMCLSSSRFGAGDPTRLRASSWTSSEAFATPSLWSIQYRPLLFTGTMSILWQESDSAGRCALDIRIMARGSVTRPRPRAPTCVTSCPSDVVTGRSGRLDCTVPLIVYPPLQPTLFESLVIKEDAPLTQTTYKLPCDIPVSVEFIRIQQFLLSGISPYGQTVLFCHSTVIPRMVWWPRLAR